MFRVSGDFLGAVKALGPAAATLPSPLLRLKAPAPCGSSLVEIKARKRQVHCADFRFYHAASADFSLSSGNDFRIYDYAYYAGQGPIPGQLRVVCQLPVPSRASSSNLVPLPRTLARCASAGWLLRMCRLARLGCGAGGCLNICATGSLTLDGVHGRFIRGSCVGPLRERLKNTDHFEFLDGTLNEACPARFDIISCTRLSNHTFQGVLEILADSKTIVS